MSASAGQVTKFTCPFHQKNVIMKNKHIIKTEYDGIRYFAKTLTNDIYPDHLKKMRHSIDAVKLHLQMSKKLIKQSETILRSIGRI